jgi:4'-phosphopantetheinyl transferase
VHDVSADAWQPPPAHLNLERDDVHVWYVPIARVAHDARSLQAVLGRDELAHAAHYHFERDRRTFTVMRGVLRTLLGQYLSQSPGSFRFAERARGKPDLVSEPNDGIRFNVSHSGELGLLAFARDREVGIDVERRDPDRDLLALAEQVFTAGENAALRALPSAERPNAFFTCWTRKEAFIKATGHGVSLLLDVEVTLRPDEPARVIRAPAAVSSYPDWSMFDLPALPHSAAALVVQGHGARLAYWLYEGQKVREDVDQDSRRRDVDPDR